MVLNGIIESVVPDQSSLWTIQHGRYRTELRRSRWGTLLCTDASCGNVPLVFRWRRDGRAVHPTTPQRDSSRSSEMISQQLMTLNKQDGSERRLIKRCTENIYLHSRCREISTRHNCTRSW